MLRKLVDSQAYLALQRFMQGRPCYSVQECVLQALAFPRLIVRADSNLGGRRGDQHPPRLEDAVWLIDTNANARALSILY